MSRADRAFAVLIATALAASAVFALPLVITLFPGGLQRALHGYDAIAAVCVAALYQLGTTLPPLGTIVLTLAATSFVLGALKAIGTLRRTQRMLKQHRAVGMPARLAPGRRPAGLAQAPVCFLRSQPDAFWRGYLPAQVRVSSRAGATVGHAELEAVVHHEEYPPGSHDPMRILTGRVLGQFLFA